MLSTFIDKVVSSPVGQQKLARANSQAAFLIQESSFICFRNCIIASPLGFGYNEILFRDHLIGSGQSLI